MEPDQPVQPPLILVVDDDELSRSLLEAVLTRRGYRVRLEGDEAGAVAAFRQEQPALVVCDVRLRGTDGFTVTQMLHAEPTAAGLPVILLTGYEGTGDNERARDAGAAALLIRSRNFDGLMMHIDHILKGQTRADSPRAG
ncbi:MAG: response regulator [Anaerolineae bacterium]